MCLLLVFILAQSAILLSDPIVLSFLGSVFTALIAVIKILFDAWRKSENEKFTLSREVINTLNTYDAINEATRERDQQLKEIQKEILNAINERNR